jgi:hypothetical protein
MAWFVIQLLLTIMQLCTITTYYATTYKYSSIGRSLLLVPSSSISGTEKPFSDWNILTVSHFPEVTHPPPPGGIRHFSPFVLSGRLLATYYVMYWPFDWHAGSSWGGMYQYRLWWRNSQVKGWWYGSACLAARSPSSHTVLSSHSKAPGWRKCLPKFCKAS